MTTFFHPPVSSPVIPPALAIDESTGGHPSIITTASPHYFFVGDTVAIAEHSTAPINGAHVVTDVPSIFTFAIDVDAGGVAGAGGTARPTKFAEPLSIEEGKLRAGLDWLPGDPRDALMENFIASARRQVENDTQLALRLQLRDVFVDDLTYGLGAPGPRWPGQSLPLWAVQSVSWADTGGALHVVPVTVYEVDLASGRLGLAPGQAWPTGTMRSLSPWVVRIVAGYPNKTAIPADLLDALGLLTAHKATLGRDLAISGTIVNTIPMGYDAIIDSHRMETLA